MALSLALGAQYAAGLPVQKRCQVHRNLVAKKPRTLVVAVATPEVKYGDGHLGSNVATATSLAKGNEINVPAAQNYAAETLCDIENETYQTLMLEDSRNWQGSGVPPHRIREGHYHFFQRGEEGSVGGVSYRLEGGKIRLIICWSNEVGDENKVYGDILDGENPIYWDDIRASLDASTQRTFHLPEAFGYSLDIVIGSGHKARMTATFGHAEKPA